MLGEISQTESQMLCDITYMGNLRKYNKLATNKKERLTDIEH